MNPRKREASEEADNARKKPTLLEHSAAETNGAAAQFAPDSEAEESGGDGNAPAPVDGHTAAKPKSESPDADALGDLHSNAHPRDARSLPHDYQSSDGEPDVEEELAFKSNAKIYSQLWKAAVDWRKLTDNEPRRWLTRLVESWESEPTLYQVMSNIDDAILEVGAIWERFMDAADLFNEMNALPIAFRGDDRASEVKRVLKWLHELRAYASIAESLEEMSLEACRERNAAMFIHHDL